MSIDWPTLLNYRPSRKIAVGAISASLGLVVVVAIFWLVVSSSTPSVATQKEESQRVAKVMAENVERDLLEKAAKTKQSQPQTAGPVNHR